MKKINDTMTTDYYEFTMGQTYFDAGLQDQEVVFDVFFRKNPFDGGYTLMGGVDNIIDYVNNLKFNDEDIEYLRSLNNFSDEFLEYLRNFTFTGSIYAIPDGTPVFPNEPVITVKANAIEAQLLETAILTHFNHGSLVTTKAKRITLASGNRPVMEFGARRARGSASAYEASKYAIIGGCVGTSNTKACEELGIKPLGTMAHSLVTLYHDEREAFMKYAKSNPDNCIFLVDTYDTLRSGIPNAIWVADNYLKPLGIPFKGIRIDSGDLAYLSKEARKMLDEAGYHDTKICLSNGLDEYTIKSLIEQGAVIDSLGVGDNIAASLDRLGGVYKLVAVKENGLFAPRIKVSNDHAKTINPGYKRVYRFYDNNTGFAIGDVITLNNETIDSENYTLINPEEETQFKNISDYTCVESQVPVFIHGKQVYHEPTIMERQAYCNEQVNTLYPEVKRLYNPHKYIVDLSENLLKLKKEMIREHSYTTNSLEKGKQKKLVIN